MTLYKTLAATFAGILSLFHALPATVATSLSVAGLFFVADTITGIAVAIYRKDLSSHKLRRLIPKLAQYAGLVALGVGAGLLAGTSVWITAAFWAICAIECLSITENLTKLQDVGANLGPAAPFLAKISKFLADQQSATSSS